jgi:hypothetical protein
VDEKSETTMGSIEEVIMSKQVSDFLREECRGPRRYFIKIQVCMSDNEDNIRTPINDFWVPVGYYDYEEACFIAESIKRSAELAEEEARRK